MPGSFEVAAEGYVPFEPRTPALRALRDELRARLRRLRSAPGEVLWASLAGELPRGTDVENALFYNLDARGVFSHLTGAGVAFERDPRATGQGVRYSYELAAADPWPRVWTLASELAAFRAELGEAPPSLARLWWALRSQAGAITGSVRVRQPGEPFAVDLRLSGPVSNVGTELMKTLLDGVICALQSEADSARAREIAPRIAAGIGQPSAQVSAALVDRSLSALGARTRLVQAHGRGIKWSPDDDFCVAARIALERANSWSIEGSAYAVRRRPSRLY